MKKYANAFQKALKLCFIREKIAELQKVRSVEKQFWIWFYTGFEENGILIYESIEHARIAIGVLGIYSGLSLTTFACTINRTEF